MGHVPVHTPRAVTILFIASKLAFQPTTSKTNEILTLVSLRETLVSAKPASLLRYVKLVVLVWIIQHVVVAGSAAVGSLQTRPRPPAPILMVGGVTAKPMYLDAMGADMVIATCDALMVVQLKMAPVDTSR